MKRIVICFIVFLCFPFAIYAANDTATITCTQKSLPSTISQADPGSTPWNNISNATVDDDKEAVFDTLSNTHVTDVKARLILSNGTIGTVDKANINPWTGTSQYVSYGGDVWSTVLTPKDVNDPNFGFAFQAGGNLTQSKVLKLTNFGFTIPTDATITNITAEVKKHESATPDTKTTAGYIDTVRMFICYTPFVATASNTKAPMLLTRIGSFKDLQAAPGESLAVPVTFEFVGGNTGTIAILYQILDKNNAVVFEETNTLSAQTTGAKRVPIPQQSVPGTYFASVSILSAGQSITQPMKFPFVVEPKIAGIFVNTLEYYGWITFCIVLVIVIMYLWIRKKQKLAIRNYVHVPEPERMYYEIIGDMIAQMYKSIGVKAYKTADSITGLTVDLTTGRVLRITKDPSEMVATLLIRYQNLMKNDLKIPVRSLGPKAKEHLADVASTYSTFDKYFRPK
jgi:hypothetical protein